MHFNFKNVAFMLFFFPSSLVSMLIFQIHLQNYDSVYDTIQYQDRFHILKKLKSNMEGYETSQITVSK